MPLELELELDELDEPDDWVVAGVELPPEVDELLELDPQAATASAARTRRTAVH
jgi:hypothetical protein